MSTKYKAVGMSGDAWLDTYGYTMPARKVKATVCCYGYCTGHCTPEFCDPRHTSELPYIPNHKGVL